MTYPNDRNCNDISNDICFSFDTATTYTDYTSFRTWNGLKPYVMGYVMKIICHGVCHQDMSWTIFRYMSFDMSSVGVMSAYIMRICHYFMYYMSWAHMSCAYVISLCIICHERICHAHMSLVYVLCVMSAYVMRICHHMSMSYDDCNDILWWHIYTGATNLHSMTYDCVSMTYTMTAMTYRDDISR